MRWILVVVLGVFWVVDADRLVGGRTGDGIDGLVEGLGWIVVRLELWVIVGTVRLAGVVLPEGVVGLPVPFFTQRCTIFKRFSMCGGGSRQCPLL